MSQDSLFLACFLWMYFWGFQVSYIALRIAWDQTSYVEDASKLKENLFVFFFAGLWPIGLPFLFLLGLIINLCDWYQDRKL